MMPFKQNGSSADVQYRYYELPHDLPVLALLGSRWIRAYGSDLPQSHFHNLMEIGYCYDGSGDMVYDTERFPYGKSFISIIPPNLLHNTLAEPGTKSRWEYLFLDAESFMEEMYGPLSRTAQNIIVSVHSGYIHLRHTDQPETGDLILAILNACRLRQEYCADEVKGLLLSLLVRIARHRPKARVPEIDAPRNLPVIQQAISFIQKNYSRDITVADVARECHVSETHCRRLFEKHIRVNPLAYISLVRIGSACKRMRATQEQISEIAIKCGFASLSTFNRNFKEWMGVSPSQWRKGSVDFESRMDNKRVFLYNGWL